jgi:hypothetical protein
MGLVGSRLRRFWLLALEAPSCVPLGMRRLTGGRLEAGAVGGGDRLPDVLGRGVRIGYVSGSRTGRPELGELGVARGQLAGLGLVVGLADRLALGIVDLGVLMPSHTRPPSFSEAHRAKGSRSRERLATIAVKRRELTVASGIDNGSLNKEF